MAGLNNPMQEISSQKREFANRIFMGIVVDNEDPEFLQRVRIRVPVVYDGVKDETLPWALPMYSSIQGNTKTVGAYSVPVIDSLLYVKFQDGDTHFPVYGQIAVTPETVKDESRINYPHRYGMSDNKGNKLYVDTKEGDMRIDHHSGTSIHILPDGSVNMKVVGNISWDVDGDITWDVDGNWTATASSYTWNTK